MKQSTKKTSPWAWIPTLYFAHHVQTFGNIQHGYRSLHRLALPAMGN